MHDEVRDTWIEHNRDLEGVVPCLYADVLGLVTCAMGNLCDSPAAAASYRWVNPDGSRCTRAQIEAAWHAVKNDPKCATKGWTYASKMAANQIRLPPEEIDRIIFAKLAEHDAALAKRFPDWEERPWEVQRAVHSMAWAAGSNVFDKFPKWSKAFRAHDYATCAEQCKLQPNEGTLATRNELNRQAFLAATGECPSVA